MAELLGDPVGIVIRPGALGQGSAAALALERFGVAPDPVFAAALQTGSGGNPLYLAALLDALWREGITPTAEQAQRVLELGPQAVARGVAGRLARLPPDATALLRAAAIARRSNRALARRGARRAGARPRLSAASALVSADLLRHENPLEFMHPVVRTRCPRGHEREASASRAAPSRRRSAARARRHCPNRRPHISRGRFPSGSLRRRDAAPGGRARSARRERQRRRLPICGAHSKSRLRRRSGSTCSTSWSSRSSRAVRRRGRGTPAPGGGGARSSDARPEIVLAYAHAIAVLGSQSESLELMRSTSDAIRDLNRDLHWRIEARLITASQWETDLYPIVEDRLALVRKEELAGGVGAGMLLATAASQTARRGAARAEATALAERALASGAFDDADELLFCVAAPFTLTVAGRFAEASEAFGLAISAAQRQGNLLNLAALPLYRGFLRLQLGELLAAEEDIRPFDDVAFEDMPIFRTYRAGFLAELLLERGEIAAAEAAVAGQVDDVPPGHTLHFLLARGRTRLESGHLEQAARDSFAAGSVADSLGIENPAYYGWWRSQAALALRQLGREDEARQLAGDELDLSRRWGAERAIGVSLRVLGLVEGGESGEQWLREAVQVLAGSPARLEHARALVDLGAALRRGNSRSEARKLLRQGVELAHQCGATALVTRGNDELAATGAHRRTVLLSGLDELTASERRVAQMAAEELSNKEIAQALFVTVKTVEQHLGRVYRKLNISSRRQLAAALGARPELAAGNP